LLRAPDPKIIVRFPISAPKSDSSIVAKLKKATKTVSKPGEWLSKATAKKKKATKPRKSTKAGNKRQKKAKTKAPKEIIELDDSDVESTVAVKRQKTGDALWDDDSSDSECEFTG
jgi:hypothetical protein